MTKVLLAEDNNKLRELITDFMSANGFHVDGFANGLLAWEAIQENTYDLVLLDIMMPEMNGFDLCEKIRSIENVPIIFITAKVGEIDQLKGFELGADDYIVKPFSLPVLIAKCNAILTRNNRKGNVIEAGPLKISMSQRRVYCNEKEINLSSLDFDLLAYFVQNEGRVLTREQIVNKVWGYDYDGTDRSVDTHVKNLRKALGKYGKFIRTIVKAGYTLETSDE